MCSTRSGGGVIEAQVARGRSQAEAERRADDPDFYTDAFFVPERARWAYLRDELQPSGGRRAEQGPGPRWRSTIRRWRGCFSHIDFNRRVGTTAVHRPQVA